MKDFDDPAFPPLPLGAPVPPPSPALLAAVERLGPVATRRPYRSLYTIVGLSIMGTAAALLGGIGLRPDLMALPPAPIWLFIVVGLAAFIANVAVALIPSPGQVIPAGAKSVRLSVLLVVIVVPLALYLGVHLNAPAAGTVMNPLHFWRGTFACLFGGVAIAAVPAILGLYALRNVVPSGGWRTGVAIGAGAGGLAGLALEIHCPIADLAHVTIGHGSVMVLPIFLLAVLGARSFAR